MSDEPSFISDVKTVWQGQPRELPPMVLAKVRNDALRFQRRLRWATVREMSAAALVIVVFGFYVRFLPGTLLKIGSGLGIVWALFYMWQWRRLMLARPVPDDAAACVDFHRRELERRREGARGILRSTFPPVMAVCVLFLVGRWIGPTPPGRTLWVDHLIIVVANILVFETFALVWLWTLHRIDKLQDQIDELDALGSAQP